MIIFLLTFDHFRQHGKKCERIPWKEQIDFDSLKKSMVFGTVVASYCVENFGVKGVKDINFNQIEKRLEIFKPYLL